MVSPASDHITLTSTGYKGFSAQTRNCRNLGAESFKKQKGQKGPTRGDVLITDILKNKSTIVGLQDIGPGAVEPLKEELGPEYEVFESAEFALRSKKHGQEGSSSDFAPERRGGKAAIRSCQLK
ncbi:MAG: hypothetical protein MHM6MM_000184 [Cercozoa sp. M6MM]